MRGTRPSDPEIFAAWSTPLNFIRRLKKSRAIKSYVKKLPGLLAKDYGRSAQYRPLQIKRTIERAGLDPIYACYAIAMFSGREDFVKFHTDIGETCDYDAMRGEVAHNHFSGEVNFDVGDIVSLYSEHGSDTSHSGSHDSGSGHGHSGH
jgi:hypothetical protein